ncbi:MAG: methyltransferase domain-containing protein [Pseudonocardiaceae bacterium]
MRAELPDWQRRSRALAARLDATAATTDPGWLTAFTDIPRHMFLPAFYPDGTNGTALDSMNPADRQRWADLAYTDEGWVVRGAPIPGDPSPGWGPCSSSSSPTVMAIMLDRLGVDNGHKVLEIGTGTGYNAALLCHRLGDQLVTSIDIDASLVDAARQRLADLGYTPSLVTGDGAIGVADRAPFDAIMATCSVTEIPPAWIDQLVPGGRIVAPFAANGLVVLTKAESDEVTGRLDARQAWFMPLRPDVDDPRCAADRNSAGADPRMASEGTTTVDPAGVLDDDFRLWLSLHLWPISVGAAQDDTGRETEVAIRSGNSHALVSATATADGRWPTSQYGRRRPWDTVEAAWNAWVHLGRPDRTRLGVSALNSFGRQYVWLDDPAGSYSWPMPL